jgi:hypothetical protein
MKRRQAFKLLGGAAIAAAAGRYWLLPPSPSSELQSVDRLAVRLMDSFDADARKLACVGYDHPLRQYHNRGVSVGGILGLRLNWEQRAIVTDLLYAGLSERGRSRVPEEYFLRLPGIHATDVLVCGDPRTPPYQIVISGPHLNLRLGGKNAEGVAFGGPQVYGDQRGDGRLGLPGNLYRFQFEIAQRLFASLLLEQQQLAVQPTAPIQTQIELQGADGSFAGVAVETFSPESKTIVRELVDAILSTYAPDDVAYAWQCLENNGGIDRLFLSYYQDGEINGSRQYQIFRLEGPAAVFYFRGYPHVHAFVNVAMNGNAPLSVGEMLGENPTALEGAAVKALFERVMRAQTGCDHAYYPTTSVVGRLRKGTIRAGDIYNLESWQERIAVVEVKGSALPKSPDFAPDPKRTYTVATTGFGADALKSVFGGERTVMLRDATIEYLRTHGFS